MELFVIDVTGIGLLSGFAPTPCGRGILLTTDDPRQSMHWPDFATAYEYWQTVPMTAQGPRGPAGYVIEIMPLPEDVVERILEMRVLH